jgi:hypothetical protein
LVAAAAALLLLLVALLPLPQAAKPSAVTVTRAKDIFFMVSSLSSISCEVAADPPLEPACPRQTSHNPKFGRT